jgi:hypothetical protein
MIAVLVAAALARLVAQVNTPEPLPTARYAPTPKPFVPKRRTPLVFATSDPRRIGIRVTIAPKSVEPLSVFVESISIVNPTKHPTVLHFSSSDLYVIDVRRGTTVLWSSSYLHAPVPVPRAVPVPDGASPLANVTFDGLSNDRRALPPGSYVVRTTFLASTPPTVVDTPLRITPPMPLSAFAKMKNGTEIVVIGAPVRMADGKPGLTDGTTTIPLSRNLGLLAHGPHVVRGFVDISRDTGRVLLIERFAPTFDNDNSSPTPIPVPTPFPTATVLFTHPPGTPPVMLPSPSPRPGPT